MKILVTGANGFIGSYLIPNLKSAGHQVVAVLRHEQNKFENSRIVNDLTSIDEQYLTEFDAVIHLAGIAHTRLKSAKKLYREINTDIACLLADRASSAGCRKFIFLSTAKVHGQRSTLPLNSSSALEPQDEYSESKARAEQYISTIVSDTHFISIRPPVVYGQNSKANIARLKDLVESKKNIFLPGKPNARSFLSIGNLSDAVIKCLQSDYSQPNGYLIDDGESISTEKFVRLLAEAGGYNPRIIHIPNSIFMGADSIAKMVYGTKMLAPLYEDFEIKCSEFSNRFEWTPCESTASAIAKIF